MTADETRNDGPALGDPAEHDEHATIMRGARQGATAAEDGSFGGVETTPDPSLGLTPAECGSCPAPEAGTASGYGAALCQHAPDRGRFTAPTPDERAVLVKALGYGTKRGGFNTPAVLIDWFTRRPDASANAYEAGKMVALLMLAEDRIGELLVELAAGRRDDPETDGTDAAHPAWWRGCDRGRDAAAAILLDAADISKQTPQRGRQYGSETLTRAFDAVAELRAALDAWVRVADERADEVRELRAEGDRLRLEIRQLERERARYAAEAGRWRDRALQVVRLLEP